MKKHRHEKNPGDTKQPLEELYDSVFAIPLISQVEAVRIFKRLDSYVFEMVEYLVKRTDFVESFLCDVIVEVLGGLTGGRTIFKSSKKSESGFESGFLHTVSEFFVATSKGDKKRILGLLRNFHFSRLVWEEIIDSFLDLTEGYKDLCMRASELLEIARNPENNEEGNTAEQLRKIFVELERLDVVSLSTGGKLYFTLMRTKELSKRCSEIRNRLIKAYLRMVFSEALRRAYSEVQVFDNFQNGYFGLVRATGSYDSCRGVSFGSYARNWVRQSIWYGLKKESGVSQHFWNLHSRIERAKLALLSDGIDATPSAISGLTGISRKRIVRTSRIRQASQVYSLDHTTPYDERTLYQRVMDSRAEEVVQEANILEDVSSLVSRLDATYLRVLALKHGLFDLLPGTSNFPEPKMVQLLFSQICRECARSSNKSGK